MASLIARAYRSLGYRGFARSLRLLWHWTRFHLRHGLQGPAPHAFDLEFEVDTASLDKPGGERKGTIAGVGHGPTDPVAFGALMRRIEIGENTFTFLDFGCGQGRALLLASEFPFRQIVGAEYDRILARSAESNLVAWARRGSPRQRCRNLAVVWEDAAAWEFPVAPSVFYLNEPFYEPLMRAVAERIRRSLAVTPRPAYVIYLGGEYRPLWEEPGDFRIVFTRGDDCVYQWNPPVSNPEWPPAR